MPKDGRTDMTKLIVDIHNLTKAPKNQSLVYTWEIIYPNFEIHTKHIKTLCVCVCAESRICKC